MTPTTKTAILPNSRDGLPTRHRYFESRHVRVDVPVIDKGGGIVEWKKKLAVGHFFRCEDTATERMWGCDELPGAS
jgi:hypothetical protein